MRYLVVVLSLLWAGAAQAVEICDELWFTRNLVFDHAGQCFQSPLGQAIFDNSDCLVGNAEPDPSEAEIVALVRTMEAEWGCDVDTTRTSLRIPNIAQRMAMIDLPVADGFESMCIGYRGPATELYTGRHASAPVSGVIQPGDDLTYVFIPMHGWTFFDLGRNGEMGWGAIRELSDLKCDSFAG
jgi:hypothetical protein